MSLESATQTIKQKISMAAGLEAKVKFDFGDDGCIFVDTNQSPAIISHEDQEADTTLECTLETFQDILVVGIALSLKTVNLSLLSFCNT